MNVKTQKTKVADIVRGLVHVPQANKFMSDEFVRFLPKKRYL